ncbi:hypothetical protein BDV96DRAFT_646345 [Lophiotrema nucula]|uniref:Uncharacterized protein n=1 Tax=Lophiotrema nucula TaxID=690887 RepID=A0A6A5Z833_9PLEO|nr:hypothetical protein BDV96DRAFT_646345 [Lophiotrema nucula]
MPMYKELQAQPSRKLFSLTESPFVFPLLTPASTHRGTQLYIDAFLYVRYEMLGLHYPRKPPLFLDLFCNLLQPKVSFTQVRDKTPDQVFPLLRLPGELRNRIYQFALFSPDGIQVAKYSPRDHDKRALLDGKTGVEFNQLKYVCRQLYDETVGLEVKYTEVIFRFAEPDEQFCRFMKNCAPTKKGWFTQISLVELFPSFSETGCCFNADAIASVVKFCRDHPHTKVRYCIAIFNSKGSVSCVRFMNLAAFLCLVFRNEYLGALQ